MIGYRAMQPEISPQKVHAHPHLPSMEPYVSNENELGQGAYLVDRQSLVLLQSKPSVRVFMPR